MSKAFIGDIHGCADELIALHGMLCHESIDEIYHLGDLVDRGPDSGAVVSFCRENYISGVMGNHEDSIMRWRDRVKKGDVPKNQDKARTLSQLTDERDWQYLADLPPLMVHDDLRYISVHAGLWPGLSWQDQPKHGVCRAQLIHPSNPGPTRWYKKDMYGVSEEEHRAKGFVRWYEVYDHEYGVVTGHTVWGDKPKVIERMSGLPIIGVDTGCNWTGVLTAVILPEMKFLSTPLKRPLTW